MDDHAATRSTGQILNSDAVDDAAIEGGRRLFAQSCSFVVSAAGPDSLPPAELPEVGFAGRSNVGKSSLVNALTGRKTLARTSNTPGRTRLLNFFDLGGRLMLVDLPGYGYARAPKDDVRRWTRIVNAFLRGRPTLRRVCLLIDARHGPKPSDRDLMRLLDDAAVNYQVVLTKADKVNQADLAARRQDVLAELASHPAAHPQLAITSARTGEGLAELRATLAVLAGV